MVLFATAAFVILPQLLLSGVGDVMPDMAIVKQIFKNYVVLGAFGSIPVISTMVFIQNITEERKQGVFQVLLANGITVRKLWRSKIIVALGIAEASNLISMVLNVIVVRILQGFWIEFEVTDIVRMLFVTPAIGGVFSVITCLLVFTLKQGQFFAGIVPYWGFFACIFLCIFQINVWGKLESVSMWLVLGCVMLLACVEGIISKISKEYLCGIGT